ncbi:MAG TPA: ATP-binding protein [Oceanospirillales bacterium]|nr:ATP-binding protein [Oceanospirillales bacterium]
MYRKKLKNLKQWFNQSNRKPLIIRGARQVGKSTLVKQFCTINQLDILEMNFERNPEYSQFFAINNPTEIINLLEINFNIIINNKTLVFLDEIQAQPQVLQCLRYFYEEMPNIAIIAAGSLLDFELQSPSYSIPVGRISYMYLQPMGFVEFLLADKQEKLAQYIEDYAFGSDIPDIIHQKLMQELKKFMAIGGMPEAVKIYVKTHSLKKVEDLKQDLLATFQNDFAKYSKQHQFQLIGKIFAQISQNIGNKIKYSNLSREHKSADVAKVIDLLAGARIISKIVRTSANGVPLAAEAHHRFFKALFLDVGLVSTQLNVSAEIFSKEDVLLVNNGELAEQWVGQALLLATESKQMPELYYWARERKSSSAEVDYVIANANKVIAVEVKAGKTGSLKSLHIFMQEKNSEIALRFNSDKPSYYPKDKILSLPLYLAEQGQQILQEAL